MKQIALFFTSILLTLLSYSQNTNISGVINTYKSVSNISGNVITVSSTSNFTVGDEVLIIQMQGATINETNTQAFGDVINYNDAGNYEFTKICTILSGTEVEVSNIQRSYDPNGKVQIITVPTYVNATVTNVLSASPWDGTIGGILVFDCSGTLTMNADINLQGLGFRGGGTTTSGYSCSWFTNVSDYYYDITTGEGAEKGEGIALYIPNKTSGSGAQANGGGGGNDHNSGGGGGSNAGLGGQGGERIRPSTFTCAGQTPGVGGKSNVISNASNKVFLGGGGGSGHENNTGTATPGANGGGIVIIKANMIVGNNAVIDVQGNSVPTNSADGAGGGGAAGSVLLDVSAYSGPVTILAEGAPGGDVSNIGPSNCNGPGGGGGGGVIWLSQSIIPGNIAYSVSGGGPGITLATTQPNCSVGSTNNATNGSSGVALTGLSMLNPMCALAPIDLIESICDTDSIWLGGDWQDSPGIYNDTVAGICCDTIYSTELFIYNSEATNNTQNVCYNDSAFLQGEWQIMSGIYLDTNQTINGCDSIIETTLVIEAPLESTMNETICEGESITINGTVYSTAVTGATETFTNIGTYGCDSIVTINLSVYSPEIGVSLSDPLLIATAGGVQYQWLECETFTPILGAINQNFTPVTNGSYAVEITDANCIDTSECYTVSTVGILENQFGFPIVLYPNPTHGTITVELSEVYPILNAVIYGVNGQIIQNLHFRNTKSLNFEIEGDNGYYFIELTDQNQKKARLKVLKI